MNLSDRVWRYTNQFKSEIEMALDIGIRDGRSAADLSRDVRQYLNYPDKLFRRVRDQHGQLHLSKSASAFHPGRGVYRSSYKNAMRLTRTETNIAYRTADHTRWQQLDFVVGIEIHISNNHPVDDICNELAGKYPKDFKFTGWHPHCRCYATTILQGEDDFINDLKNGTTTESENAVKELPRNFKQWMERNGERIERAKTLPYFLRDNERMWKRDEKSRKRIEKAKETDALPRFLRESQEYKDIEIKGVDYSLSEIHNKKEAIKYLRRQDRETAFVLNSKGTVLKEIRGGRLDVAFDDEIMNFCKDKTVIHNHPLGLAYPNDDYRRIGNSLSKDDMKTAVASNMESIIAYSPLYEYKATRRGGSWDVSEKDISTEYSRVYREISEDFRQCNEQILKIIIQHLTMKVLAKKFGFTYTKRKL